jgi:uncharacterized protein YbjT (DUF2867 family)
MRVLVTGAAGYVGQQLVPRLLAQGHQVRVLVREARPARGPAWPAPVDVAVGDLTDSTSLASVFDRIDAAYYLVHSLRTAGDFAARDRAAAENFARAAPRLGRVIYLGGIPHRAPRPSAYLDSRVEVGRILRSTCPVTEFRAGPLIGAGSAPFDLLCRLTQRLPLIVAPRSILNAIQPIAAPDALRYLLLALERDAPGVFEIGAEALSVKQMLRICAEIYGLKRVIVPAPLPGALALRLIPLLVPIRQHVARHFIEAIAHPVLADTRPAQAVFPEVQPLPFRQAAELALA